MRWQGQRQSENVEDRRRFGPARIGGSADSVSEASCWCWPSVISPA